MQINIIRKIFFNSKSRGKKNPYTYYWACELSLYKNGTFMHHTSAAQSATVHLDSNGDT